MNGYVLLETILAFSFFLIIVSIVPLFIVVFGNDNDERIYEQEVELFFQQLARELKKAKTVFVEEDKIHFSTMEGELVTIEKYGDKVRRQVFQSGHEVMLQKIKDMTVRYVKNGVVVIIADVNGKVYERRISLLYRIAG